MKKNTACSNVESLKIYVLRSGPSWSNLKDFFPETSSSNTKQLTTNLLSDNNCSGKFWARNYTTRSNSRFSITGQPHSRSCSTKSSTKRKGNNTRFFSTFSPFSRETLGEVDLSLILIENFVFIKVIFLLEVLRLNSRSVFSRCFHLGKHQNSTLQSFACVLLVLYACSNNKPTITIQLQINTTKSKGNRPDRLTEHLCTEAD